jgi:hypothetical protein
MAATPIDFRWSSQGGILLDGTGDIADTTGTMDSIQDIVRSRLKSALDGWKLYQIGAGLIRALGQANNNEVEIAIQRRVVSTMTNDFLAPGSFTVSTLPLGDALTVFVYIQNTLVASATITPVADSLEVTFA